MTKMAVCGASYDLTINSTEFTRTITKSNDLCRTHKCAKIETNIVLL